VGVRHPWSELFPHEKSEIRDYYVKLIPDLIPLCRQKGYAAAIHGSMTRDLDVVLVPWTYEAAARTEVISHLLNHLVAPCPIVAAQEHFEMLTFFPTYKPHGRICHTLFCGYHLYLDLSFMPLSDLP